MKSYQVSIFCVTILEMKTLKEIREENAISIRDLAKMSGVSTNTIVRLEKGLPARHVTRRAIAKALHKHPSDIDFNLTYKLP